MVRRTILQYYVLSALFSCVVGFTATTYVNFLISKGLNLFEVNLVNTIFFVTLFLCEIPTGAFADVFGRKASFVVSCFLWGVGNLVYVFSDSFWHFALAEAICAVGATFSSGAFQAWLVDEIKHHGYEGKLDTIFARASYLKTAVLTVAAMIGAYIGSYNLGYPWILNTTFGFIVMVIAMITIRESYFERKPFSFREGLRAMRDTAKASIRYATNDSNVRFVLVLVCVMIFGVQALNMQWAPFYTAHVGQASLSWVWLGIAGFSMLGAWLAPWILKHTKSEKKALVASRLVSGATLACLSFASPLAMSLAIFFLHEMARGTLNPIKDAFLHDNIPSQERATIISFESMAHHIGGAIGLVASGAAALKLGIPTTWMLSGSILVLGTLLVAHNGKKNSST
jgi:MFS family permease